MSFIRPADFQISKLNITIDPKRKNPSIGYGEMQKAVAFVTPEATTKYPRVSGDGNFHEGNPYCPATIDKASYTLDLQDFKDDAAPFLLAIDAIDERLLKFFTENQKTLLNRTNLSEQEVKMLQHRNVKHKDEGKALSLSPAASSTQTLWAIAVNASLSSATHVAVSSRKATSCQATTSVPL